MLLATLKDTQKCCISISVIFIYISSYIFQFHKKLWNNAILNQNQLKVFPKKSIIKIAVKDLWFFFQLNPEFGFLFYLIEFYWDFHFVSTRFEYLPVVGAIVVTAKLKIKKNKLWLKCSTLSCLSRDLKRVAFYDYYNKNATQTFPNLLRFKQFYRKIRINKWELFVPGV